MQTSSQIKKLVGKQVRVATPHMYDPTRFFYYNGKLISVDAFSIELLNEKGKTVIIQLDRVLQVEEC